MLTVKQRQEKLKYLGFYTGAIDGIEGVKTKRAYYDLQKKYMQRKKDIDGIYGTNTEKLLESAYNVKRNSKNFDIKKDKLFCRCKGKYCCGFPAIINADLMKDLQSIRDKYGRTTVTSMLRCKEWNKKVGGTSNSRHLKGEAVDYRNNKCLTLKGRKQEIDYWMTLKNARYSYCNGYYRLGNKKGTKVSKGMGISIHGDVK